jgi:hypothetical protein
VVSNSTNIALAKAAMELRAASPKAWNAFLSAVTLRLDDVTEACITSTPERLQEAQGRAREIRDLFKALHEAPQLAQQLQEKERNDGSRRQPQTH